MPDFLPIPDDGLTIAQAHDRYPWFSIRSLRGLRQKRVIPSWVVCGHVVFSAADLEALPVYSPPVSELVGC